MNQPEEEDEPSGSEIADPYLDENGELPVDEEHHRQKVQAAMETVRTAGPFALIPIGLILLLGSLLFGDWVWGVIILLPLVFYAVFFGIPLVMRLRKGGELRVPGHGTFKGKQKRNALISAMVLALIAIVYVVYGKLWELQALHWLRETLAGWTV